MCMLIRVLVLRVWYNSFKILIVCVRMYLFDGRWGFLFMFYILFNIVNMINREDILI